MPPPGVKTILVQLPLELHAELEARSHAARDEAKAKGVKLPPSRRSPVTIHEQMLDAVGYWLSTGAADKHLRDKLVEYGVREKRGRR